MHGGERLKLPGHITDVTTGAQRAPYMPTLLVFLKYPHVGHVKTRLAASLGAEQAASLYREWIGVVLTRLQSLRGSIRIVAYYDGAPLPAFAVWHPLADQWWAQPEGDLGVRLAVGFEKAHNEAQPVIAIGTDCLELDSSLIRDAISRLVDADAVFGPAPDGGYYLVGTSSALPEFFEGIPWSTPETLTSHLALCKRIGWNVSLLPVRRDIDTVDDWLQYCSEQATKLKVL